MATTTTTGGNMPQAATPPATDSKQEAPPATDSKQEAESKKRTEAAAQKEWQDLVQRASEGDTPAARQVQRALTLEGQRAKLMKQVSDNRDYLRLMDRNEELNSDQTQFLDTFYPEKEKGERRSQEDIDATRRAREAARKNRA